MKVSSIFLAVSLAVSAGFLVNTTTSSQANGSMGIDVRRITVKQSGKVRAEKIIRESKRRAEKAETQRRLDEGRALVKEMEKRDREYQRKMDDWAKDLKKKRK